MANAASTPPTCPICGAAHWMRDPHLFAGKVAAPELLSPRPAKNERRMVDITPARKWTAALTEVLEETRSGKARGRSVGIATQPPKGLRTDRDLAPGGRIPEAGTQARPVDTTSRAEVAKAALGSGREAETPRPALDRLRQEGPRSGESTRAARDEEGGQDLRCYRSIVGPDHTRERRSLAIALAMNAPDGDPPANGTMTLDRPETEIGIGIPFAQSTDPKIIV